MSEEPEAVQLPAIVVTAGGALAEVLAWQQYRGLPAGTMYGIIAVVETYPELNTQSAIDLLADAVSHYGVELSVWFEELLRLHGIDRVHLAIESLTELGIRPRRDPNNRDVPEIGTLRDMLELLEKLADAGLAAATTEGVADRILLLGGWIAATRLSVEEIQDIREEGTRC